MSIIKKSYRKFNSKSNNYRKKSLNKYTYRDKFNSISLLFRQNACTTYRLFMYNAPSFCVHRTVLLCTPHRPTAYSVPSFYVHHTVLLCTPHRPTAYSVPSFYVHHTVLLCTAYRPIISIIPIAKANNNTGKQVGKQVIKQAYKQVNK